MTLQGKDSKTFIISTLTEIRITFCGCSNPGNCTTFKIFMISGRIFSLHRQQEQKVVVGVLHRANVE
jgi:hypothetical protein